MNSDEHETERVELIEAAARKPIRDLHCFFVQSCSKEGEIPTYRRSCKLWDFGGAENVVQVQLPVGIPKADVVRAMQDLLRMAEAMDPGFFDKQGRPGATMSEISIIEACSDLSLEKAHALAIQKRKEEFGRQIEFGSDSE